MNGRLPPECRTSMERSFGTDFSDVQVHESSSLASSIGALAVTDGRDLHFAAGQFQPGTEDGRALIGHELAHVVQHRVGAVDAVQAFSPGSTDPLEREADEMGARAARGEPAQIATSYARPDRWLSPVGVELGGPARKLHAKFAVQIERAQAHDTKLRLFAIHFSGRTDSPFAKSMGAHTTAWVVHCDHVRACLIGCTLDEAAAQLALLCSELEQIADWSWKGTDWATGSDKAKDDEARGRFRTSRDDLATHVASFASAKEETPRVSHLQRAIAAYLEARNYLPMATIDSKRTGGNTEGVHRANLPDNGGTGDLETAWALFDANACAFAATTATPAQAPGTDKTSSDNRIAQALAAHALAFHTAYPKAFACGAEAFLAHGVDVVDAKIKVKNKAKMVSNALAYFKSVKTANRTADELRGDQSNAAEIVVNGKTFDAINAGRPDSPFSGTQGAHTTAWVVHEDALNTAIGAGKNGDVKVAAQGVLDSIDALDKSPLAPWVSNLPMSFEAADQRLPQTGGEQYGYARKALDEAAAKLKLAVAGDTVTLEMVQQVARLLLQVENLYPMATVSSGSTNPGTGERSLRTLKGKDFLAAVWTNFDLDNLREACTEQNEHKRTWDNRVRGVDPMSTYEGRLARAFAQHLFYVKAANPVEFAKHKWYSQVLDFAEEESESDVIAALTCKLAGEPFPDGVLGGNDETMTDSPEWEDDMEDFVQPSQSFDASLLPAIEKRRDKADKDYAEEQAAKKKAKEEKEKKKSLGPTKAIGKKSTRGGKGGKGKYG